MGNLSFLHPTIKKEKFEIDFIFDLLKENFHDTVVEKHSEFDAIQIIKNDEIVCDIYFLQKNYLIKNIEEDLRNMSDPDSDEFEYYQDLKKFNDDVVDKETCVQITYSKYHKNQKTREKIVKFVQKYFECYWLDDGIHPELIKPNNI